MRSGGVRAQLGVDALCCSVAALVKVPSLLLLLLLLVPPVVCLMQTLW